MTAMKPSKPAKTAANSSPSGKRVVDLEAKVQDLMKQYPKTMARLAE